MAVGRHFEIYKNRNIFRTVDPILAKFGMKLKPDTALLASDDCFFLALTNLDYGCTTLAGLPAAFSSTGGRVLRASRSSRV